MSVHPDLAELRAKYELAAETPTARAVDGLTFLTGLYLAISPWVVGFQSLTPLTVTNVMTGLVMVGLAFGLAAAYERFHGLAWVIPVLGIWTLIAPWVVRGGVNTTPAVTNNVIVGIVAILLGACAVLMGRMRMRR
jgi:hypothetical protein